MILVDRPIWWFKGERWSHLVSDTSLEELHAFAASLGVPRRGFQGDHYDIPERAHPQAIALGATLVDGREIVRALKASGLRLPPHLRPKATQHGG